MIVIGIAVAAFQGKIGNVGTAAIDSSKEAVMLCITMLGVMSMWTGIMNVAKKAGLIDAMTRALRPVLRFLFPDIPREHEANEYIAANIIANVLGLGWAATPYGLKAMAALREWQKENGETGNVASTDMCTFLIINISSLQLIPVNIIAYRSQYGSVSPTSILGMGLVATLFSTAAGVLFSVIARKCTKRREGGKVLYYLSDSMIPLVLILVTGYGLLQKVDIFDAFIEGAVDGFKTVYKILPTLIGLMIAIGILRESGTLGYVASAIAPVTERLHFPSELVPLVTVKMFSSSAATSLLLDVYKQFGPDSRLGVLASVLMSCSETIFYTMSVYFMTAKVTKTRYTLAGALFATLAGIAMSMLLIGF